MNTISQVPTINTRQTVRRFGINLTNYPLPSYDRAQSKSKKNGSIQPNKHQEWFKKHPQVAPYFQQIIQRNKINENYSYITDNYMLWHSDISIPMRQTLVGWLISLQYKMKLSSSTLYLAVNILDKYCYQKFISCEKYQLLGLTSLFIAAKYQEIKTPRLKKYAQTVLNLYIEQDILNMESQILVVIGFNLKVVTVFECLQQTLNFLDFDQEGKRWCRYVLDLILLEYWSCLLKPSLIVQSVVAIRAQYRGLKINISVNEQQEGKQVMKLINLTYMKREEDKFKQVNCKYNQSQLK